MTAFTEEDIITVSCKLCGKPVGIPANEFYYELADVVTCYGEIYTAPDCRDSRD